MRSRATSAALVILAVLGAALVYIACRGDHTGDAQQRARTQALGSPPPLSSNPTAPRLYQTTRFLYSGDHRVQFDIDPDLIKPDRLIVLHGQVSDRAGQPLSGLRVSIHGHPEFGHTSTRDDGHYHLVANDIGPLSLDFHKPGFIPAQRSLSPRRLDYNLVPELWLSPFEEPQRVDLDAPGIKAVRGRLVTDSRGARRATLLFAPGTRAHMVVGDDRRRLPDSLDLRITEYTEGDIDPRRLHYSPPSGENVLYSLSLSVDQARAAGVSNVAFQPSLTLYVENILLYPVGFRPGRHTYEHDSAQWTGESPSVILKVLSTTGGVAQLDADGDGLADSRGSLDALGISAAEQQKLATLYLPGQQLVRSTVSHFSSTGDQELQGACCSCCAGLHCPAPKVANVQGPPLSCKMATEPGSVIECYNQYVGESFPVVGTPFSLNYQSNRVQGLTEAFTTKITLSDAAPPPDLVGIDLKVEVAGQVYTQSFTPAPNLSTTYTWDGKDAFGQVLNDQMPITTTITYTYMEQHGPVPYPSVFIGQIGLSAQRRVFGLGGLELSAHHSYDPWQRVLYLGDGDRVHVEGQQIQNVMGGGTSTADPAPWDQIKLLQPVSVQVSGGTRFPWVVDRGLNQVKMLVDQGLVRTAAGTGVAGFSGDGGPPAQAQLNGPSDLSFSPYDYCAAYIADTGNHRIRRIDPAGSVISTVAGTGVAGFSGDGGPATAAQLNAPQGVLGTKDGSILIADTGNHRIRRVDPSGIITTWAGTGVAGFGGDGGPYGQAQFNTPTRIASLWDGRIDIADSGNHRVRMVDTWGVISTVAGTGVAGYSGDGGPGTGAQLSGPQGMWYDVGQRALYIADAGNARLRKLDRNGVISTVAGTGTAGYAGDGSWALQARLSGPSGVALLPAPWTYSPAGPMLIADSGNARVRSVSPVGAAPLVVGYKVPSADGSLVYLFDGQGQHQSTVEALTGATRYVFNYVSAYSAVLDSISDVPCAPGPCTKLVSIVRDANGQPLALMSADGQRTMVQQDANGYLSSITNPAGETVSLSWSGNLLANWTDARSGVHTFTYDSLGRLAQDVAPGGSSKSLNRTTQPSGWDVDISTAMGRASHYHYRSSPTGAQSYEKVGYDGLSTTTVQGLDGSRSVSYPDGSSDSMLTSPDPRFGLFGALPGSHTAAMPSGLSSVESMSRAVVSVSDPNNPVGLSSLVDTATVNGQSYTRTYSGTDQTVVDRTPAGRQVTQLLDNQGRVSSVQVPGLTAIQYTYDTRSRITQVSQGTRTYSLAYDAAGNLASVTDPLSRVVSFSYDLAGRPTQQTLPDSRVILFQYDHNGNVTSVTPPGRSAHAFSYTPADLTQSYTPPDLGAGSTQTQYSYNLDRQLTQITRPDGNTLTPAYDTAGRLSTLAIPGGQLSYAYDAVKGYLNMITAPVGGTVQYAYDGQLLTDVTWTGSVTGSLHQSYDNNFRLISETVDGGNTVSFQYDQDGLLTGAGMLSLSRDPGNGLLTGTSLGMVSDVLSYNTFGELAGYTATAGGTTQLSESYARDAGGRISQKVETIQGVSHTYVYTYDTAGRLVQVQQDGVVLSTYTYDSNSNRLTYTSSSGTVNGTYDAQDRMTQYGTKTYTYTANGELHQKVTGAQTTTYTYDVLGNLTTATLPGGTNITYLVDGQARRVGKKVNGSRVQEFLYGDALHPVAELDGSNNLVSRFIYASGKNVPDFFIKGGVTYRLISDHLGSPRLVFNTSSGAVAQRMDYDEFGNVLQDTNPGFQPFGFAGGIYDQDTKLVRFGLRDYDPEVGRWVAKDPISFEGGDLNLYGYDLDDPVNWIDPSGSKWAYPGKGYSTPYNDKRMSMWVTYFRRTSSDAHDAWDSSDVYRNDKKFATARSQDESLVCAERFLNGYDDGLNGNSFTDVAHWIVVLNIEPFYQIWKALGAPVPAAGVAPPSAGSFAVWSAHLGGLMAGIGTRLGIFPGEFYDRSTGQ